jgi:hypothetical protein
MTVEMNRRERQVLGLVFLFPIRAQNISDPSNKTIIYCFTYIDILGYKEEKRRKIEDFKKSF